MTKISLLLILGMTACSLFSLAFLPDSPENSCSEITRADFHRHMNLVILNARIKGKPVKLLVDSGSSTSLVLDSAIAEKIELEMSAPKKGGRTSQGGQFTMRMAKTAPLQIGDFQSELKQVLVASCRKQAQAILGIQVDGILGTPFLHQVVLEVDYEEPEIVIHDPEKYNYNGNGTAIPIDFNPKVAYLPFATAEFELPDGKRYEVKMLVDSGGSTMATAGLGLKKDIQKVIPTSAKRIPVKGVSGLADSVGETMHSSFMTRLHRMKLGPYDLERPVVSCGSTHRFNLFGAEVLRRFHVVFDFANERMIIEPNASFAEKLEIDKSGIMLVASPDNILARKVQYVTPESPASRAGIKAGDELVKINGKPASSIGLHEIREMFFQPDQVFELEVKRQNKTVQAKFQTEKML